MTGIHFCYRPTSVFVETVGGMDEDARKLFVLHALPVVAKASRTTC